MDNFDVGNIGLFCIFMELCEYFAQVRRPAAPMDGDGASPFTRKKLLCGVVHKKTVLSPLLGLTEYSSAVAVDVVNVRTESERRLGRPIRKARAPIRAPGPFRSRPAAAILVAVEKPPWTPKTLHRGPDSSARTKEKIPPDPRQQFASRAGTKLVCCPLMERGRDPWGFASWARRVRGSWSPSGPLAPPALKGLNCLVVHRRGPSRRSGSHDRARAVEWGGLGPSRVIPPTTKASKAKIKKGETKK